MPTYRIEVVTGEQSPDALAGSDAKIRLTLYGTSGSTDELLLEPKRSRGNGVDTFRLGLGELGEIQRLRVGYDDTGVSPAWFLDGVRVFNEVSGVSWVFPCQRWLSRHHDDGATERVVDAARAPSPPGPGLSASPMRRPVERSSTGLPPKVLGTDGGRPMTTSS